MASTSSGECATRLHTRHQTPHPPVEIRILTQEPRGLRRFPAAELWSLVALAAELWSLVALRSWLWRAGTVAG